MERHRQRSAVDPEAFEALRAHVEHQDAVIEGLKGSIEWLTNIVVPPSPSPDLLSIKQAAFEAGGYSESSIRFWIKDRRLKAIRVGGRAYVKRSTLAAFVEKRRAH
jgi:hypothetical protein